MNTAPSVVLPNGGLDYVFYNPVGIGKDLSTVNSGIWIAVIFAIVMYIILNKTTFGYKLKACGFNKYASKYAGINEKREYCSVDGDCRCAGRNGRSASLPVRGQR